MVNVVFIRESMNESLLSDAVTFALLLISIWFSRHMGGGYWEMGCTALLIMWLYARLPMESTRVLKLRSKADALAWAQSLPDDERATSPGREQEGVR